MINRTERGKLPPGSFPRSPFKNFQKTIYDILFESSWDSETLANFAAGEFVPSLRGGFRNVSVGAFFERPRAHTVRPYVSLVQYSNCKTVNEYGTARNLNTCGGSFSKEAPPTPLQEPSENWILIEISGGSM